MDSPTENMDIGDYPYIKLDEAIKIADKVKDMGKATADSLAKAMEEKNAGYFRLKLASVRRWGLVEGRGEMRVTQAYKDIKQEKRPNHALEVKRSLFLKIPMYAGIYHDYENDGLPQEPYLTNAIRDKYKLQGRYPTLVANIVREFINEYFPNYGQEELYSKKQQDVANPVPQSPFRENHQEHRTMLHKGTFPIKIITQGEVFDWDIKGDVDWKVVDSVIQSIKERWKDLQKLNSSDSKESGEDER